ncbi:MAG: hypothetical protein J6X94_11380 [Lachnospiraceae bacterium]|nr:hypothetical protein [Lachnospiraceae bacterium]MBP5555457.1 hypothetical protein [Lachnospiraceae bacterium]MBP5702768.1 hypothetical protein [Lachnospiraceae bacterium]
MSKYFDIVAEVIEDVADISRDEINMDSSLMDDLELSSLELMTIFSDISRKTSIPISNKNILEFETVADIVAVLDAHS